MIELLAVVAIIGILSSIIIPKLAATIAYQELRSTAEELANDMRYIQELAIAEGHYCDIRFYPADNPPKYRIYQGTKLIETKPLPKGISFSQISYSKLTSTQTPTIRFNYEGNNPPTAGTVGFINDYNQRIKVISTPVTARIRIEEQK